MIDITPEDIHILLQKSTHPENWKRDANIYTSPTGRVFRILPSKGC